VRAQRIRTDFVYYIVMSMLCLVFLFPLYWMFTSSFKPVAQIFVIPYEWLPRVWITDAYERGWKFMGGISFGRVIINTFYIAGMNVVFTLFTASLTAFAFARIRFIGRDKWFIILLATMMLPSQVTMVPTYLIMNRLGLVNTFTVLFIGSLWGGGAFNIFLIRQFMMGIPTELDDAAKIDGASIFMIYWKIILPLCKTVLITIAIWTFNAAYNDLMGPLIYVHDMTKRTVAPAIRMYLDEFGAGRQDVVIALTTVSVAPLLALFFACQKHFIAGIKTTGLKG